MGLAWQPRSYFQYNHFFFKHIRHILKYLYDLPVAMSLVDVGIFQRGNGWEYGIIDTDTCGVINPQPGSYADDDGTDVTVVVGNGRPH